MPYTVAPRKRRVSRNCYLIQLCRHGRLVAPRKRRVSRNFAADDPAKFFAWSRLARGV